MNLFVKLLLILLFDSYSVIFIVPSILYIIGTAFIFKKSGIKWYFALIPCVREYQLARCAYREPEGRVYSILSFLYIVAAMLAATFDLIDNYIESYSVFTYLYIIVLIALLLALFIFNIRMLFIANRVITLY